MIAFADSIRQIRLNGEAYFEVTHDSRRPFTIYANGAITRVLETAFNIRARQSEEKIIVTVKEGKVSMADSSSINNNVLLEKGEKGIFNKKESRIFEEKVSDENYVAAFDKVSLKEAKQMLTWGVNAQFDTVNGKLILKKKK